MTQAGSSTVSFRVSLIHARTPQKIFSTAFHRSSVLQKKTIFLFWRYTRPYKLQRTVALVVPIVAVIINAIAAPYLLSTFINKLQSGGITLENSLGLIISYAALVFVGEVVAWRIALYFTWTFQANSQRDLYLSVFNKLSRNDMSFHANRFGGSLVSQTNKLSGAFERFWDMVIWSMIPMLTTIIGSIIALIVLGLWQYSIFLFVYSVLFSAAVILGSRFLAQRNRDEAAASTRTSGYIADMVTNVATVKAFGREQYEHEQAAHYINRWHDASNHLKWGVLRATSVFSTMTTIGATGALIFAALSAESGLAAIGTIYLMFIYTLNINRQLWEMNSITRAYNRVIGDANDMVTILHSDNQLADHSDDTLKVSRGTVAFNDVSFAHDEGKGERVFNGFNLTILSGQRVGIVGHSGSGKSTLTRILLRFSDIDSGTITIDGQDISRISQQSLHENIAYVPQEPLLFHRTLRDNIAYGRPEATLDEVILASKKANAWDFIERLPEGLDTLVGERGVKLSGGQRQRIAIARAILKDAPILVLDEATSALDSESEKLIQDSLDKLMQGRTSIVIAHRLSTIAKLDRIIVLENGRIIEDGTHSELLRKHAVYASLWAHQSGGFIEM